MREGHPQRLAGKMKVGAHGSHGYVQHLCDFPVFPPLQVVQEDHLSPDLGERLQRSTESFPKLLGDRARCPLYFASQMKRGWSRQISKLAARRNLEHRVVIEAVQALEYLASGQHFGKVVIRLD